jgi:NAD+ kinase
MRAILFGADAETLKREVRDSAAITVVTDEPDVVICFGGDGTLLAAELRWPGVPKVPIRNSRRGIRCIAHPPAEVIQRLVEGALVPTTFCKLECGVVAGGAAGPDGSLICMNEFNVHMGLINSAVRFTLWFDGQPHEQGQEIIGDGFVISTPFGSTAYFSQITHGIFFRGIGVAFKATDTHIDHVVAPEESEVRARITRGPAKLAYDNAPEYVELAEGDELVVRRHAHPATILTVETVHHPCDAF